MNKQKVITKTLYVPIEIFDRELGSAILLASCAVSRGWQAVVGGKQAIFNNFSRFKQLPGVFFLKSLVPGETFMQKKIAGYGHKITSLDVEGLVPSNGKAGVCLRYSEESIALADMVFFWGREHYRSACSVYPEIKKKAVISGSPIIDELLVKKEKNWGSKNRPYKHKILIGTSCGYANHLNGIDYARKMSRNAYRNNLGDKEISEIEREALLDERIFDIWKQVTLKVAAAFEEYEIVLRPHPSENKEFWREHLKGFRNVRINDSGSIIDEMIDSDIYIHFNSTTAFTSNILDIPTIMLLPDLRKELYDRLTFVRNLSTTVATSTELIRRIRGHLEGPAQINEKHDLSKACANIDNEQSASEVIIGSFDNLWNFDDFHGRILARSYQESARFIAKRAKRRLLWIFGRVVSTLHVPTKKYFPPVNTYKVAKAKQPDTHLGEIYETMEGLLDEKILQHVTVCKLSRNLFLFNRNS